MNKIPWIVFCVGVLCVVYFFLPTSRVPSLLYRQQLTSPIYTPNEPVATLPDIAKINSNITSIQSFSATLRASVNDKNIRLTGMIAYQRNRNFRMQINSILGKESDIGSNNTYFWFYSKRLKPAYLYYALYRDIDKVPLKPMFHPVWLMESLGVLPYAPGYYSIERKDRECWLCTEKKRGLQGQLITTSVLIDSKRPTIIGRYLFNNEGRLIASAESDSFYRCGKAFIPKKIRFMWQEEQQSLTLELENLQVNNRLPDSTWQPPRISAWDISRGLP